MGAPLVAAARVVGTTRGEISANIIGTARTSANQKQRFRKQVFVGQGGAKAGTAKLSLSAFGVPDSGVETNTDAYTAEAHFEVNGVAYPFTWGGNGAPSGLIPTGSALVESGTAAHPDIAPGTMCYALLTREYAVGALPVFKTAPGTNTTGDSAHFAVAGTDAGIGVPGAKTATGGWTAQSSVFDIPFMISFEQLTKAPAIVVLGASIERDQADVAGDGTAGGGYIPRGLNPSGGTKQAFVVGAKRGESLSTFLASGSKRLEYLKYANSVILGFGGNDFTNGVPVATALASLSTLYDLIKAAGVERVALLGMVVKTDSNDNWTTVAGQTTRAGFVAWRTAFHAGAAAMGITVIDTSSSWEEAGVSPPVWKANGVTANLSTPDGTHPTTVRHQEAGAALQSQLGSFLVW
ncbi:SGNH/GDSL hydrolase family protein [Rhizobium skierniewicense]|uniref:SGNH/GDSL hydrolase family protein n=1 Tax=Rhizobium skierniewicense TaxID=984260 RepID=UPI001FACFA66